MIPITAGVIGGLAPESGDASRRRGGSGVLVGAYVLALSLVYAALGTLAGLTGTLFGTVSASPWASLTVAVLLLVYALLTLDVISWRVPRLLAGRGGPTNRTGLAGATLMGAGAGLVMAPCSAPVMAAVLTWVASTRSSVLGFAYLFAFSLGMSALLVAVGMSSALVTRLPRAGAWMVGVRRLSGFLLLAAAEWLFVQTGRLLP
jgi:cytochrome c-type biogenesis protein